MECSHREYALLLLNWNAAPIDGMRSSEVSGYYKCLLKGIEVPPRRKARWYADVLAGKQTDASASCVVVQEEDGVRTAVLDPLAV